MKRLDETHTFYISIKENGTLVITLSSVINWFDGEHFFSKENTIQNRIGEKVGFNGCENSFYYHHHDKTKYTWSKMEMKKF